MPKRIKYRKWGDKKTGVYIIRCIVNGKVYIGAAKNLSQRMSNHVLMLSNYSHGNKFLKSDSILYGWMCFEIEVLEYCNYSELDNVEKKYFEIYNCCDPLFGYNIFTSGKKNRMAPDFMKIKVIDNDSGKIYDSVMEASNIIGVSARTISRWLKNESPPKINLSYHGRTDT